MKKYFVYFSVLSVLLILGQALTGCLSDGDETVSLEFANVKKMIVGEWVLESNSGTPRVLTITDDGYYTDSSDGGTKKHTWRLSSDYSDGQPYYGGIYLDGVYYDIVSWGDGHWRLKDRNGKIFDFSRDGGADNNNDPDPNPTYTPGQAIDLGLPSKTLWASCNVGATKPEEYGLYFAWGETKGYTSDTSDGHSFDWANCKWCNGAYDKQTKYCNNSSYGNNGFTDNKTELDLEDDAAYMNWGSSWRMPSKEQQDELRSQCKWEWTQLNGVYGRKVTGPNGNSIFLPAAGCRDYASLSYAGFYGYYWSRTLHAYYPSDAYDLNFGSGNVDWGYHNRCDGQSVRPVRR